MTKMVAIEEKVSYRLPEGPKNIEALVTILGLIMKHELGTTSLLRKGGGGPADFERKKLSPAAQQLSQLDDVGRNLSQQLSHKWLEMIQEGVADAAKAEGLAANGSGTNGKIPGNNEGNNEGNNGTLCLAARELFFTQVLPERGVTQVDMATNPCKTPRR
jgi:hypothetical protein